VEFGKVSAKQPDPGTAGMALQNVCIAFPLLPAVTPFKSVTRKHDQQQ
jgi:hypothetical protein